MMLFLSGLLFFYTILWLASVVFPSSSLASSVEIGRISTGLMFILIGLMHFIKKEKLEEMIPDVLQHHARLLNYLSGATEILLGILVLIPSMKVVSAFGLIILLILVFPANVNVAMKKRNFYNVSRLFFQPVYIFWIWFFCLDGNTLLF